MSDEAIITDLLGNGGDPIEMTCLDNTGIAKGTVLELEDLRTVKKGSAVDVPLIGIAAAEKVADDGATTISVITNCIAKVKTAAGGSATIGDHVSLAAADNTVNLSSTLDEEKGWSLGYALEDAGASETLLVRIRK